MSLLSTHLHLAILVLNKKKGSFSDHPYPFLLGNIAPDCVNLNDNTLFYKSHFVEGHVINCAKFIDDYLPQFQSEEEISFIYGYHCHLWLDEYDKANNIVEYGHPESKSVAEQKTNLRNEIKAIDRDTIVTFDKTLYKHDIANLKLPNIEQSVKRYKDILENVCSFEYNISGVTKETYHSYLQKACMEYLAISCS